MITIVICTHNRAELLADALQSACTQSLDPSEYEVIVVDNNSTDNTRAVAESFIQRFPNVRYCFESKVGVSHARNRGWQEAKGDYVGYLDDDGKMPPQWASVAEAIIADHAPTVFAGPYFPFYKTPKPAWFRDRYESSVQQEFSGPLEDSPDKYLSGTSLVFVRSILQEVGGFDPNLGMKGQHIGYAEEKALVDHIRAHVPGALIYYEPQLFVYHFVRPHKTTMRWVIQSRFTNGRYAYRAWSIYGAGYAIPAADSSMVAIRRTMFCLLQLVTSMIRGLFWRDRSTYPYVQNYWHEHSFRYLNLLGQHWEQYQQARSSSSINE